MSDINGLVTGIQDVPVNSTMPTDGQTLVFSAVDGYYKPGVPASAGLRKDYFTADGYWTAPDGVTNVLAIGCGGGGGGASGNNTAGSGGGGALQQTAYVSVTPGVTYTITIGAGGLGGASISGYAFDGNDGLPTKITDNSNNVLFCANGAAHGELFNSTYGTSRGGICISGEGSVSLYPSYYNFPTVASGASAGSQLSYRGASNPLGNFKGGITGSNGSSYQGGGGGGAGPQGNGGDGSAGAVSSGASSASGGSALDNTGAGGGGGGSANWPLWGGGGNGGSGYLYLVY